MLRIRLKGLAKRLRKDREGSMNAKEFGVFAVIVFLGLVVGGWVTQLFGITGTDLLSQLLAFLVPVLAVYVLWKKLGTAVAK